MVLIQLLANTQKNANWSVFISLYKNQVQVNKGHPHETRYTGTNRKETTEEPWAHGYRGKNFLNRTPIVYALRSSIDKGDLIKLQSFCKVKDTVNRTKHQPTNWEKIFAKPTFNTGIISNIYKALKKLDSREPNKPINKWGTELNKEFLPEEYQMPEKHLKKCSTLLVIREMQIQTTLRFHLTTGKMAKILN